MGLIERYILKNVAFAFAAGLFGLTLVIWITEALKQLDLITGKGQTFVVFLMVTVLSLPALITVIAPIALFIATIYALNRLNGDSELIVMSAAGVSPARLIKPFVVSTVVVGAIVGWMTIWLMPQSLQGLRGLITQIRADFVANVVKEGQFTTLDTGITFHYRERSGDALLGIFFQDRRDPEKTVVYLAERGKTAEVDGQSYLLLEKGLVQRQEGTDRDSAIIAFERYTIDLSVFGQDGDKVTYKPRERSTADLISPDIEEDYYRFQQGRFRAELHDRLTSPLYPIAFMLIAFAALGEARTTRQGRSMAVAAAIVGVVAVRILGFAASSAAVRSPAGVVGIYAIPLAASAIALAVVFQGPRVKALARGAGERVAAYIAGFAPLRLRRA